MVQRLAIEIQGEPGEWLSFPPVQLGDRDGTISDNREGGRDIYLFGVDPINNVGYVKKSELGLDVSTSGIRRVDSVGFVIVATLNDGESHELTVRPDRILEPRTLRFTYFQD